MAQLLFYDKPVALNKETHKGYKIDGSETMYAFARKTNSVILAGVEFMHAAKEYAVVFVKAGEKIIPVALLGLRNDENLFVDDKGKWNARYIPAFVRRYPFVLAESPDKQGEMAVCIDGAFPGFNTEKGQPLFEEAGEPAPLLKNAIQFLQDYQAQYQRTEIFLNRLKDLDLLVEMTARADMVDGQKLAMGGLLAVDEKKLLDLDKTKALELFRSGELGWIYAHMFSLANMNQLVNMIPRNS